MHDTRAKPDEYGFRGRFDTRLEALEEYSTASGILAAMPTAVAHPLDASDVAALVAWAAATGAPLHPRGAGTGMPGGNVGPGVVVDLAGNFRATPEIDPARRMARVAPGVTLAELNAAAAPAGLRFPVDPSSAKRCTLGGMIANNAGGAHSVKYGSTRRWIYSLDLVLGDGTRATLRRDEPAAEPVRSILRALDAELDPVRTGILERWPRVRKNSSGYALAEYLTTGDAVDLIAGSEGTLALIVSTVLRLAPIPAATATALIEFDDLQEVGPALAELLPLQPATCEILDRTFLDLVRDGPDAPSYPLHAGIDAILIVEVEESAGEPIAAALDRVRAAVAPFATRTTTATTPEGMHELWALRHAASPIIARTAGRRISMQFIEDSVVPVPVLSDYIVRLRAILARHGLPAVIFGHAGDGNLHVNPLVDIHQSGWREVVEGVIREVAVLVVSLGGTLSGEHGDGRLRAPLLRQVWGEPAYSTFRQVKSLFDPAGILNPGVIIPLPEQRPLDELRYPA